MKQSSSHVFHEFPPVFDRHSEILILGSFPSVRSREIQFYYGHPQNRFWDTLNRIFGPAVLCGTEDKIRFLLEHHIALWDVLAECEIRGSSDSSIRGAVPNDLGVILRNAPVKHIFLNGKTALRYFLKYQAAKVTVPWTCLPSTSPANAKRSREDLYEDWKCLRDHISG